MKIIICCLLMIACVYLGVILSNNIKRKKVFWDDVVRLCEYLSANIGFGQKKIDKIILEYIQMCSEDCKQLLNNYIEIKDNNLLFNNINDNFLDKEEKIMLTDFFKTLGELDTYNELIKIDNYKARFSKKFDFYLEKNNKFSPLVLKLSIIFGIVICIVFI